MTADAAQWPSDAPSRVVLAHDYLTEMGGAERVVAALVRHFPDAPLLTSGIEPEVVDDVFSQIAVRTPPVLGRLLSSKQRARVLFPLLPWAFRLMRVPACDVLLSSSSGFAHHLRPPPATIHVSYVHTPPRFLWDEEAYFQGRDAVRNALRPWLSALRSLDRRTMRRVDVLVANSRHTQGRIREVYGRGATVVHPPVDTWSFRPSDSRSGTFLVVSRLLPYKRIDIAIQAAAIAGVPLDVIGDGPDRARLEAMAGAQVRFLGRLPDPVVRDAMARCEGLVVPGSEDFGLTIVEAQASGRPPIVRASGGAIETVDDGRTGYLVGDDDSRAFAAAMRKAMTDEIPTSALQAAARRFDTSVFTAALDTVLVEALSRRPRALGVGPADGATAEKARAA
jgi:glycosyltransferase involved in cell wall biosynthesis